MNNKTIKNEEMEVMKAKAEEIKALEEEADKKAEEIEKAPTEEELELQQLQQLVNRINLNKKVITDNFAVRLVYCYEKDKRAKFPEQAKKLEELVNKINSITFDYAIKDNKYIYLINKTIPTDKKFFELVKSTEEKKDIITVTFKNLVEYLPTINLYLKRLERLAKEEEEKAKAKEEETAEETKEE